MSFIKGNFRQELNIGHVGMIRGTNARLCKTEGDIRKKTQQADFPMGYCGIQNDWSIIGPVKEENGPLLVFLLIIWQSAGSQPAGGRRRPVENLTYQKKQNKRCPEQITNTP